MSNHFFLLQKMTQPTFVNDKDNFHIRAANKTKTLFLAGFPPNTEATELAVFFQEMGYAVESINIKRNYRRPFAFIGFTTSDHCLHALQNVHGLPFQGGHLHVDYAVQKKKEYPSVNTMMNTSGNTMGNTMVSRNNSRFGEKNRRFRPYEKVASREYIPDPMNCKKPPYMKNTRTNYEYTEMEKPQKQYNQQKEFKYDEEMKFRDYEPSKSGSPSQFVDYDVMRRKEFDDIDNPTVPSSPELSPIYE